jgi:hypothetical protein
MTGRISILKFLLTVIGGTLLGGLVLGIFGFLLAGKEGFVNMVTLGLVIGFFGALILRFAVLLQSYGLDIFGKTRVKNLEYGWFVKTRNHTKMKSK